MLKFLALYGGWTFLVLIVVVAVAAAAVYGWRKLQEAKHDQSMREAVDGAKFYSDSAAENIVALNEACSILNQFVEVADSDPYIGLRMMDLVKPSEKLLKEQARRGVKPASITWSVPEDTGNLSVYGATKQETNTNVVRSTT